MHFFAISGLLVTISNFSMAIWVYLKGRTKKLNILWAIIVVAASIWGFGGYKFTTTLNKADVFLWLRIAYIGVIFLPTLFCHFVYTFLGIRQKKTVICLYLFSFFALIINFISKRLFLGEPGIIFSSFYWVTSPGPIWFLFVTYFIGLVGYSEYKLLRGYKTSSGFKQNQIKYFYFASLFGFGSGATCFLPCFGINLYPGIGNIGVALYCIPMAHAIVKYRVMDIKLAITRTGIFVAVYTLVLGLPFAIAIWLKNWLMSIFDINWWILPSGLMAISATVGPFVYIYLQRRAEDRLLKEQRRYQEVLKQAGMEMTRIHNLQSLLNLIVDIVTKNVRISHSAIYSYNDRSLKFQLKAGCNINKNQPISMDKESSVVNWLKNKKESLVYEEIREKSENTPDFTLSQIKKEMQALNTGVIVPSFLEGKLLNLLVLGNKLSKKMYTYEDLAMFSILANQMAIGIENASLYENMEEQVRQRTKELVDVQKQLIQAEKLATVGTLAGGVAHEINNPLTAILTNVQMLLASDTIDDKLDRESLELIEEATKRCRTIVQKLMTYARKPLETTQISQLNLLDVFKTVLSFIGYQLEQDNIKIVAEAKDASYPVMGNHNELEQVLTNLILNAKDAIKLAKKGGVITVSFSKSEEWIRVDIKDEGMGIPKEIASKIFDPFFTTKDVGRGVGLGLSICQAIVEKHNGMITFRSEPNKGSVFTIQLPRTEKVGKAEVKEAIKHEHPQKPLIEKLAKKNILIIDDDGIITKTLCDLLKEAGYYADASQNGFDAVDKTKDAVFDLIIADIRMPGMDGVQTIKRIKEISHMNNRPEVPTIFITGYADSRAALEAKKLGEVISKPFDTKEFLAKVAMYI